MLWESGNHRCIKAENRCPSWFLCSLLKVSAAMTIALVHNFIMQESNNQGTKDVEHKNASISSCTFGGCGNQGFPDMWLSRLGLDQSRTWKARMIFTNTPFSMHLESSEQGASYLLSESTRVFFAWVFRQKLICKHSRPTLIFQSFLDGDASSWIHSNRQLLILLGFSYSLSGDRLQVLGMYATVLWPRCV